MLSVVHVDVIRLMSERQPDRDRDREKSASSRELHEADVLRTECHVLLQMVRV
jgi:hypothetical protein